MTPIMEGTHTVLLLYAPIHEISNISLYFPKRRAPSFKYKSRAPYSEMVSNDHDQGNEDLGVSEQKGQSSCSSDELLISQQATKEAVAELSWLAEEHHQLLADLLSLCRDCAIKVRMGNQDGKVQDYMEGQEVYLGGQGLSSNNYSLTVSPEHKRATTSKGKKLKKLGGKKLDSAEDLLHSKMKKKVTSGTSSIQRPALNNASISSASVMQQFPDDTLAFDHVTNCPVTGSYASAVSNPILPMEEPFQIGHEGWDFMEDNRTFDPYMDFCNDFSEYDGELGYEASFCSLMEGLTRRESGSNLRPIKRPDSLGETVSENLSAVNQSNRGVRMVDKVQDGEGRVPHVNHTCSDRAGPAMLHPGTNSCQQGFGKWRGPNREHLLEVNREKTGNKLSEGLRLPLSHTTEPNPQAKSHTKSPSSPSLAGVFNTSFPASNSLLSMSPVLSPLSSKQASPQLNHRIVLLSDKDVDHEPDSSRNRDETKIFTEDVDKNGNKRTVTRLDLNLSRRPSNSKWNSSSNSTTTEDPFLRQDDIWMLDGDEPHEHISRVPRPDHLDFLRITPPEDDIIGDTPYCPKLECTAKMDSVSNNSDGLGRQPTSSLLNVFSSIFSRDTPAPSDAESAVLTSFKELSDEENPLPEASLTTNQENKLQGRYRINQNNVTASYDTGLRAESWETCKDQVKTAAGALVDLDLVQVTRVETYSDSEENEDEKVANSSTSLLEKLARTREPSLPEEGNNTVEHGDGDELKDASEAEAEYQVPVFRTHKLEERSLAILYSDRFVNRTNLKPVLVPSVSKQGDGVSPKERTTIVSLDVETSDAGENGGDNVENNESEEFANIDCSLPLPSIFSGHLALEASGQNAATASALKQDFDSLQKAETHEQKAEDGTEEPHSSKVSNSAVIINHPTGLKKNISPPSATEESPGDIQPRTSPAQQSITAPKTSEIITPPPASSNPPSSTSSPSKGMAVSSPASFQMPALFSGLRVLKKGAVGEDRETVSEIKQSEKDADLALLSLKKTVNKAKLFPEQNTVTPVKKHAQPKPITETKSTVMGHLSQLLNVDNQDETKKADTGQDADPENSSKESDNREEDAGEKNPGPVTPTPPPEKKKTSDLAYETFKNIFGPKIMKKEKTEDVDLEAVKRRIKNEKESLRSIFERASKSPGKELNSPTEAHTEVTSPTDSEDRTPGRLQAVWPPPKPKDEEEKVGLKYTEAEHQAALLQLKRECKEDLERMHVSITFADMLTPGAGPAPPPPPPGCGPPPPPPMGFSFDQKVEKAPRKLAVEPACPMKPLYWTRIQIQDNNNNTLWGSLEEPNIVCANEFEELFSKATLQPVKKPLSDTYEKKAKTKKIIKLLDGKRSQAVGILISSLHLEMKDIKQAVLTVDNSVVDLETIEALYENRATNDELVKITRHYENSKEDEVKLLDKPEQFLYELSQIPDFAGRAHCIIFQSVFLDTISSIRRKVEIISNVSKELLECNSLRDVLGLVLAFGNYMNGGNRTRGQADGFGLEILPKLKDVKSRDNRMNLVDYVVLYYLRNFDKHAGTDKSVFPMPEPQDFFQAGQVKFEDLTKDIRKLRKDLTACEKSVQKVCANSSEENLQPFKEKMEGFISAAQKEHSTEEERLSSVQRSFQDMVSYFGVKPKSGEKDVAPSYVFMFWYEFCNDFKNSWIRQNKNISKERLKEAQENIKKITAEKRVETKKINGNSLKERLRQKEAGVLPVE
ncbi:formin-1-like [Etheostoma cragini]|uniref:formin-1-like n=1 Tax=Etheostoma cragini TaxID=417921 RepID=UPI00155E6EAA|nr:formin-1-like [Etheostoma cragini]